MLWYAYATIQIHIILVWKVGGQKPTWSSPCDLIASTWWPLWAMKSNLNLVLPFVILIMRHWNSQDAVIFMQGSKHTQSWFGKWGGVQIQLGSHLWLNCQHLVNIVGNEVQSQPCLAIYSKTNLDSIRDWMASTCWPMWTNCRICKLDTISKNIINLYKHKCGLKSERNKKNQS